MYECVCGVGRWCCLDSVEICRLDCSCLGGLCLVSECGVGLCVVLL